MTIVDSTIINTGVQVFLLYADFDSPGYMPRSGIAGSYSIFVYRGTTYWFL
jgi:hypothetical protein